MLGLHLLAHTTRSNILSNVNPHTLPPKELLQITVHLSLTRMHRVWRTVSLMKDICLHLGLLGHTKTASETNYTILV
jgi:hypothetical protein